MTSINRLHSNDAARTYVQNAEAARTAATSAQQGGKAQPQLQAPQVDTVSLSDSARSLAAAHDAVQNAPEVRHEKVAEIKQRIGDGTYQVQSRVLAQKLLGQS
jgi:negative regulator of flagellin synthesis FlgM